MPNIITFFSLHQISVYRGALPALRAEVVNWGGEEEIGFSALPPLASRRSPCLRNTFFI